ncbi:MAG TPA: GNAT family N-acetyltransferase [Ancylobacter sp.]
MSTTLTVTFEPTDADQEAITAPLVAYNRANGFADPDSTKIAVLIKDEAGTVIGGLFGFIGCRWLYIVLLVVPEELRRTGLGTRLLGEAEAAAKARGCIGVWLDTYSFQAPDFYLRNGYEAFGELKDHPPGATRIFLRKSLV